jgi:hypothetical protein
MADHTGSVSSKENSTVGSSSGGVADAKEQPRTFNPVDQSSKGNVSQALNADAGRYKKGPGPL